MSGLREKIEKKEFGKKKCPTKIIRLYSNILTKFAKLQKIEQRKNEKVDFSNFFKRNDLTKLAYKKTFSSRKINEMSKILHDCVNDIY